MNIFDLLAGLQGGQDPNKAILAATSPAGAAALSDASGPPQAASPAQTAALPPIPQANAPAAPQTPVTNPQSPQDAPKAYQSPPDLANMYLEMLKKNQNAQQLDSGASLIAAGFSKYPETRAALVKAGAGEGAHATPSAADFATLQKMQLDARNQLLQQAALKGLMKQYNMTPEQIGYLQASGKLGDVLQHYSTEAGQVIEHPDGTKTINNMRTGQVIAEIPGEVSPDTEVVENPVTHEKNLIDKKTGQVIKQVSPPQEVGQKVSEDVDALARINKDRAAAGQAPLTMEKYLTDIKRAPPIQVNVGPQGEPYPAPPSGYAYQRTPDGKVAIGPNQQPLLYPIQGGPEVMKQQEEALKLEAAKNKEEGQKQSSIVTSDAIANAANQAMKHMNDIGATGYGSKWMRGMPLPGGTGTESFDAAMSTLKGNITIEKLNQMRQSSPSGGALGQVSDFENRMLSDTTAPLNYAQKPEEIRAAIIRAQAGFEILANKKYTDAGTYKADLQKRMDELSTQYSNQANTAKGRKIIIERAD